MQKINPIIVNFNTPEFTLKCVNSIIDMGVADAKDIIVVDNASLDDSSSKLKAELPKNVHLILLDCNRGYSAGINAGATLANHDFILVLNPDTYFIDNSLSDALDFFSKDASIGLIGLDLLYPSGERQYSARRFYCVLDIVARRTPLGRFWPFKNMIEKHMMAKEWDADVPFDADWVMGTGFIVRRELFEKIGRMDETYFLYMEDVDLCARVWGEGFRVVCFPNVRLIHDHQRSSHANPLSGAGKYHLQSLGIFRKKFRLPLFFPPGVKRVFRA